MSEDERFPALPEKQKMFIEPSRRRSNNQQLATHASFVLFVVCLSSMGPLIFLIICRLQTCLKAALIRATKQNPTGFIVDGVGAGEFRFMLDKKIIQ